MRAAFPAATNPAAPSSLGPDDDFFNRFAGLARVWPILPLIGAQDPFPAGVRGRFGRSHRRRIGAQGCARADL